MDQLLDDLSEIERAVTLFQFKMETLLDTEDARMCGGGIGHRPDPDLDLLLRDLLEKFRPVRVLLRRAEGLARTKRETVEEEFFFGLGEEDVGEIGLILPSTKEEEEEEEGSERKDPLAGIGVAAEDPAFTATPRVTDKGRRRRKSPIVVLRRLEDWELDGRARNAMKTKINVTDEDGTGTSLSSEQRDRKGNSSGITRGQGSPNRLSNSVPPTRTRMVKCPACQKDILGARNVVIHCRRTHPDFCMENPHIVKPARNYRMVRPADGNGVLARDAFPKERELEGDRVACSEDGCPWEGKNRHSFLGHLKTKHTSELREKYGLQVPDESIVVNRSSSSAIAEREQEPVKRSCSPLSNASVDVRVEEPDYQTEETDDQSESFSPLESGKPEPESAAPEAVGITTTVYGISLRKRKKVNLKEEEVQGELEGDQEDRGGVGGVVGDQENEDEDWVFSETDEMEVDDDYAEGADDETEISNNSKSRGSTNFPSLDSTQLMRCADPSCDKQLRGRTNMIKHCRLRHPSFCEKNPDKIPKKRNATPVEKVGKEGKRIQGSYLPPCQFNSDGNILCMKKDCTWVGCRRPAFVTHMKRSHPDFLLDQYGVRVPLSILPKKTKKKLGVEPQHDIKKPRKSLKKDVNSIDKLTEKKYPCPQCDVVLSCRSSLKVHIFEHTGERPFLCSICGYSCKRKGNLEAHMITHSTDKPYKCDFCDRSFRWPQVLKKHCLSIHPDKIGHEGFLCNLCGANLTHKDDLRRHMKYVHEGHRRFSCPQCPKAFKYKTHPTYHIRTHSNSGGRQRGLNKDRVYVPKKVTKKDQNRLNTGEEKDDSH